METWKKVVPQNYFVYLPEELLSQIAADAFQVFFGVLFVTTQVGNGRDKTFSLLALFLTGQAYDALLKLVRLSTHSAPQHVVYEAVSALNLLNFTKFVFAGSDFR